MSKYVLSTSGLFKSFGDRAIIRGVDLDLVRGERHAVIGPNGAGKSTLFNLLSGKYAPSAGEIVLNGKSIRRLPPEQINRAGLSRSFQITNIFPGLTVMDNLRLAAMRPLGLQFVFWQFAGANKTINRRVEELLHQVRLEGRATTLAGELPYSEQRSLELGMTIASDPEVILLDEPMAGMSKEETDYTVTLIRTLTKGRSLLVVEHDMDVVFQLSDTITVLVYGKVIASGTPTEIRTNQNVREAYLGEEGLQ